ncbi:hypothetical protein [Vibrio sp. OPT18]|uniref:hypothetical protein n=1 Tax=Vibrio sp. OPT18 TaxID=2778641 RepID=UPI00187DE611|nr:hypothetical protein [Vibrio sp. OPT18]MBE8578678.1 hypothetical protein [Vibrio sp. OPT18]
MPLLTEGFDSIIGTDFELQLPNELKVINPAGASIVDGKLEGKAIRLTNGAYLQFNAITASSGYLVYAGCSFKFQDVIPAQELAQISLYPSYRRPYEHTDSVSGLDVLVFIKDGQLFYRRGSNNSPLITIRPNQYYYLEFRHQYSHNYSDARENYVEIWLNGILLHRIKQYESSYHNVNLAMHFGSDTTSGLDIDDLYIFHSAGYYYYGHTYSDSIMPILASGKVKTISVVNTQSNTFGVTGAASAHEALSDNNDATFISSNEAAEASLNIDTNVGRFFSANLKVRASSDSDGVITTLMSDSTGAEITGSKQTVALGAESKTLIFPLLGGASGGEALAEKIKAGSTLKVTT